MSKRRKFNAIHVLLAISIVIILAQLVGCSSPTTPVPAKPKPSAAPAPAPVDDLTRDVFDMTWGQTSEADKTAMCYGVRIGGHAWTVDHLSDGGGADSDLDWDAMADLMADKCESEGR